HDAVPGADDRRGRPEPQGRGAARRRAADGRQPRAADRLGRGQRRRRPWRAGVRRGLPGRRRRHRGGAAPQAAARAGGCLTGAGFKGSKAGMTSKPADGAPPRQERALQTYERLLDVAGELLAEVGVERISTNMICARAGMTPPALYRYFKDKYAVLEAL